MSKLTVNDNSLSEERVRRAKSAIFMMQPITLKGLTSILDILRVCDLHSCRYLHDMQHVLLLKECFHS